MTSVDVMTVLVRRWYLVLAGLALTAGAMFSIHSSPGVYSTQADVLFLAPRSAKNPNPIEDGSESLIATTGLVARIVSHGKADPPTASSGVTLLGQGIRQGYSVRLPNSGGQWANNFDRPVLDIQVTGPSSQWVRSTLDARIAQINRVLFDLQAADGVEPQSFITTSSTPELATVAHSNGQPKRAMAATLLLGTALTGFAAVGFDRIALRRRRPSPSLFIPATPRAPLSRSEIS